MRTSSDCRALVSIIIPFFNQADFVLQTVLSAKRQTYPNVEILVVDDGSPTPAAPLLAGVTGVQLLRTENGGVSAARNLGFARSSGDFLIFLDSDDLLLPGAIEAHFDALDKQPFAGIAFGPSRRIDRRGSRVYTPPFCRPRIDYFYTLLESNPIACPGAAMISRETFARVGMFDESFRVCEDYWLYLKIARIASFARHEVCVVEYRQHGQNITVDLERMLIGTMAVLDLVEPTLSDVERKRLPHARRRWRHEFRCRPTLIYRIWSLYYRFRAMWRVPVLHWFSNMR